MRNLSILTLLFAGSAMSDVIKIPLEMRTEAEIQSTEFLGRGRMLKGKNIVKS